MKIVNAVANIRCNSSDNVYKNITSDQVTIDENKEIVLTLYTGSSNGGYSQRYTRVTQRIIDSNVQEALVECDFASFYHRSIRASSAKRFIIGKDDGSVFVTQVKKTVRNIADAFDSLIPKAARVPGAIRQGDIWLIPSMRTQKGFEKGGMNASTHRVERHEFPLSWEVDGTIYTRANVIHPEHGHLHTGDTRLYRIVRNRQLPQGRRSD